MTVGALNVDWRVPLAEAIDEYNWIWSWARIPGVPADQIPPDWIVSWINFSLKSFDLTLPLCVTLIFFPFALRRRPKLLFFLPIALGLIYWFITAPNIRFAAGLLWLSCAFVAYYGLPQQREKWVNRALGVLCFLIAFFYIQPIVNRDIGVQTYDVDGSPVYVTVPPNDECIDHPLPCSPYLNLVEQLEFRVPGNLAGGFRSLPEPHPLKPANADVSSAS